MKQPQQCPQQGAVLTSRSPGRLSVLAFLTGLLLSAQGAMAAPPPVNTTEADTPAHTLTAAALTSSTDLAGFTPAQQAAIGRIAGDYVANHPEVLVSASQALQTQQVKAQQAALTGAVLVNQQALLHNAATPTVGPKDAKVAVVEFFDYQCLYCVKMASVVTQVMKKNPGVQFKFQEFPIFGSRWPASSAAAEGGQTAWALKGASGYQAYHEGLFATGKNEGKLTEADISGVLRRVGVSADDRTTHKTASKAQVQDVLALGQRLGLGGTPAFIVMPLTGATAKNTVVLPGAVSAEQLQAAIKQAGGKGA